MHYTHAESEKAMNLVVNHCAVSLDHRDTFELIDAAGTTATVDSGCLWITMDGDRRDIVLHPGDSWTVERNGRTLVHAEVQSKIRLTSPEKRSTKSIWDRIGDALTRAASHRMAAPALAQYY